MLSAKARSRPRRRKVLALLFLVESMDSWFFLPFPRCIDSVDCGSGRGEELSGGHVLRLIRIRLATLSFEKNSIASQVNSPAARTANSSSRKAVSFSSAVTKRICDSDSGSYRFNVNSADFNELSEAEKKHFYQCRRCGEMVD